MEADQVMERVEQRGSGLSEDVKVRFGCFPSKRAQLCRCACMSACVVDSACACATRVIGADMMWYVLLLFRGSDTRCAVLQ